ncbi:AraC family transcriptional regulator [Algoriphagus machipongonensis]|uniref:Transcriptional activator MltR n=1 Tax=Algoriphagus machipongonensis TaxID=388413 RepID=A3HT27_9BACT|nr:AraC family transcriptional regulator [Algoriphagus machipongonensis]EAZ82995.1 putative transcriptional activator MltR [Algoriphagus machipongonensis]
MKNPLKKSRIPDTKVFVVKELIAPYFDKYWHFHPEYQLVVILKGRGTRYIGDDIKPFKEGDLVMTGPNLPHVWRSDDIYFDPENDLETHLIVIYFPEDFLGNGIFEKEEFEDIGRLMKASIRGLSVNGKSNAEVTKMMKKLVQLKGSSQLVQLLEILTYLSHSKDITPITNPEYINLNKESEKDRMGEVYEYVMNNYKSKITLQEVAELANLSVSAFSRFFKSRANKSFSDFVSDVRISHACKLLHEEDIHISEVCYESGFNTLSNFNKQFKDRIGKTPLNYRKEYLDSFIDS